MGCDAQPSRKNRSARKEARRMRFAGTPRSAALRLDVDLPAQVFDRMARDQNAVAAQRAAKLPAPGRELLRRELGFAKTRGPVRDERAVRRPRGRILRNALPGREKPVDVVRRFAWRGDRHREGVERGDTLEIRLEVPNPSFGLEDDEQVAREIRLARANTERRDQRVCDRDGFPGPRGKIHAEQLALAADGELPAARAESHALRRGQAVAEEDVRGGERRVTAEIDLHRRRKPAKRHHLAASDDEGGLGEVVLRRDRREHAVRQPRVEEDHCGGISAKGAVGKGVDLVERELHFQSGLADWGAGACPTDLDIFLLADVPVLLPISPAGQSSTSKLIGDSKPRPSVQVLDNWDYQNYTDVPDRIIDHQIIS